MTRAMNHRVGGTTSTPPTLTPALARHIEGMTSYARREIQAVVPEFAAPGTEIEQVIRIGVTTTISRYMARTVAPSTGPTSPETAHYRALFRKLGRNEFREGRPIDQLQLSFNTAGRACWQYLSRLGPTLELGTEPMCRGAEAIFATIEEIGALAADGYARERAIRAGAQDHQRARLLQLILSDPVPPRSAVIALAADAGWAIPTTVAVVALEPQPSGEPIRLALDTAVLRDLDGPTPFLLTADPDRRLGALEQRLGGTRAVISPTVPLEDAAPALKLARDTLGLVARGVLPDRPLTRCNDHLRDLLLLSSEFVANQLIRRSLSDFARIDPGKRNRMGATLQSWLRHDGNTIDIADDLGIHPQTVRYRMNQLAGLLGVRLDDPDARLDMWLALRISALLGYSAGGDRHAGATDDEPDGPRAGRDQAGAPQTTAPVPATSRSQRARC